jgi:hypothetical protein
MLDADVAEILGIESGTLEVVRLSGDQSVDGEKTFIVSPVVPTPTDDFQAATKKYVDDNIGGGGGGGTETTATLGTLIAGATAKSTPVDADLIPLTDSTASNITRKLSWANAKATLKTYFDALYQPINSVLTAFAALTQTNDNILQVKSGAWTARTPAQVKTDLALTKADVGLPAVVNSDTTTTANITDSTNKRFVTDAQLTTIGNQSGTNTGDETTATIKSKLGIATLSGSNTGDQTSIVGITGTKAQFNTAITDDNIVGASGGTFTGHIEVPSDAYDETTWDANLQAATKNDIRDKIEAIILLIADKVAKNASITGATKTKVTYDAKGLVTAGADATTADIADSTNKRYVTDAQLTVIGNTSGTNTGNQTSIVGITGTTAQFNTALTDNDFATLAGSETLTNKTLTSPVVNTPTGIVKGDVGLGNVDNTADSAKPVSTAQQTALNLKANLISPSFTTPSLGDATATTQAAGDNDTSVATTAFVQQAVPNSSYRSLLDCSGSHTAAKVAGTYGMGQGDALAVSGTGTLYPLNTIYIAAADYPTVDGKTAKLRIRAQLHCNDVAPFTGTFVIGLHPITRPATSGGAGLVIYTIGAAVSGSTLTFTNPAADSSNVAAGSDFALPADGHYVLAVVTNQTMAASAHVHVSALLQMRNN